METTDSAHDIAPEIAPEIAPDAASEVDPADPVFAPLMARRVAIVGFAPAEEARLNAVFSKAGASCHAFHSRALQLAVRTCDVVLVVVDELRPVRIESFPKPVIACITPESLKHYTQWIRNSACDWFFCPGTSDELLTRVTVSLQRHAGSKRVKAGRAFCVLLADDDPMCHHLFRLMIQGQSMLFRAVDDGRKALEVARDWQPDLVVLDVNMPFMDGFEVLAALKSDAATKETPVIMVTGNNQDSHILRGLRLGAKDYVVKPFNTPAVLERIRQLRTLKFS
jgi:DNA-binding response OmpR family regulator